jgi:hypothetical protein
MINFVVVPGHGHTLLSVLTPPNNAGNFPVQVTNYRRLLEAKEILSGTWVFCDIERLAPWELRLAAETARLMREASVRVLNDPARAVYRYELLLRLHEAGFNGFRAWRAEDGIPPARFPVFLRFESDHKEPISDLIENEKLLAAELDTLEARGIPRRGLIIIEYQAEPLAPGVFRKFAAYRFGERIVADHLVHETTWLVKNGAAEAWNADRYADEKAYVRDNPHSHELMRAFEIAKIEYGRADYGLVGGKVQVWEINTNPMVPRGDPAAAPPERTEATILARDNRLAALLALDSAGGQPIQMDSEMLLEHRKRQRRSIRDMIRG